LREGEQNMRGKEGSDYGVWREVLIHSCLLCCLLINVIQ
jgi:hypothetical protein